MQEYRAGTVIDVLPAGTIVTLLVRLENDRPYAVHFDHRPFYHMIEDLGMAPAQLVGQRIEITQSENGEYVRLPDL
jgi:hypothetical protein